MLIKLERLLHPQANLSKKHERRKPDFIKKNHQIQSKRSEGKRKKISEEEERNKYQSLLSLKVQKFLKKNQTLTQSGTMNATNVKRRAT